MEYFYIVVFLLVVRKKLRVLFPLLPTCTIISDKNIYLPVTAETPQSRRRAVNAPSSSMVQASTVSTFQLLNADSFLAPRRRIKLCEKPMSPHKEASTFSNNVRSFSSTFSNFPSNFPWQSVCQRWLTHTVHNQTHPPAPDTRWQLTRVNSTYLWSWKNTSATSPDTAISAFLSK